MQVPIAIIFKRSLAVVLSCFCLVTCANCHKDVLGPKDGSEPGGRDYSWTVDTIFAPYNMFRRLSGSSPTDLWIASPGDADKSFLHYDGASWRTDSIFRAISPTSIFSIAPNNVWAGGPEGRIWHFDGSLWSENYRHLVDSTTDIVFEGIYASSASDVYAVGACFQNDIYWGIIIHYDGKLWNQVNIQQIRTSFVKIRYDRGRSGNYFLLGLSNEWMTASSYQFYELRGTSLTQIRSGSQATSELGDLLPLDSEVYFIVGYDLCSFSSTQFIPLARLSNSPQFLNSGVGRRENDILLAMTDGIAHFNGTDTEYLYNFSAGARIIGFEIFEKDVFFAASGSGGNNYVFHGRLR